MRNNYSKVFAIGFSLTADYAPIASETLFGSAFVLALLRQTIFYCRHQVKKLTDEAPAYKRHIAIETLNFVKSASVVVEDMHDDAAIVNENPLLLRYAFA